MSESGDNGSYGREHLMGELGRVMDQDSGLVRIDC